MFCLFLFISMPLTAFTQEPTNDKKIKTIEEEQVEPVEPPIESQGFINYGLLDISVGYRIAKDGKHIIYKIKNNTRKSIDKIFGHLYQIKKDKVGNVIKNILANNPNASAILISKYPHKPSALGTWRFTLKQKSSTQNIQYMLSVNDQSIFYAPLEIRESQVAQPVKEEEGETLSDQL
tara:strand:+ start:10840 stop:11373 length:534 start_codon:yes stop_codon:yes gene_type:complete